MAKSLDFIKRNINMKSDKYNDSNSDLAIVKYNTKIEVI